MRNILLRAVLPVLFVIGAGVALAQALPDDVDTSPTTDAVAPPEAVLSEEVMPTPIEGPPKTALNPQWQPPVYSAQDKALGWTPEAFAIPKGMDDRVHFWEDIYTKYSSEQGILHDSLYVNVVYESVDFADISADQSLTLRQKAKARKKRVDGRKKEIAARLKRLGSLKTGDGLTGDDQRYWDMFAKIDEPKKWAEASKKGRLRFQLGQKDIFAKGIYNAGRYVRQMEEIFRAQGLPIELTRLPFVESSFNLKARSRVGASGIWQFMRGAARPYMRMDASGDERNDPLRATLAAAQKLRDNYKMLGSWPLAITAYNHGPAGVRRLTEKLHTTDIVELLDVRRGRFKFASASFFASFLAALNVERRAEQNFGRLEVMPELRGVELTLAKNAARSDILNLFAGDETMARLMNPGVAESVWRKRASFSKRHVLRVPAPVEAQARAEFGVQTRAPARQTN
jgi:membrane-bound lytic murein transglycosylase D